MSHPRGSRGVKGAKRRACEGTLDPPAILGGDKRGPRAGFAPGARRCTTWTSGDPPRILRPRKSSMLEVIRPEASPPGARVDLSTRERHTGRALTGRPLWTLDTEDLGWLSPPGRGGEAADDSARDRQQRPAGPSVDLVHGNCAWGLRRRGVPEPGHEATDGGPSPSGGTSDSANGAGRPRRRTFSPEFAARRRRCTEPGRAGRAGHCGSAPPGRYHIHSDQLVARGRLVVGLLIAFRCF